MPYPYFDPYAKVPIPATKEYRFTDEQIDTILRVMRDKVFASRFQDDCGKSHDDYSRYDRLANFIEYQIVNHSTNV